MRWSQRRVNGRLWLAPKLRATSSPRPGTCAGRLAGSAFALDMSLSKSMVAATGYSIHCQTIHSFIYSTGTSHSYTAGCM